MKERIHWIDVTKGILIILMVLGHIQVVSGDHGIDNSDLIRCIFFSGLWGCFFMQAFFVLTGYTTNFEKDFKSYFISNVRTLVVPWISFSIITRVLGHLLFNQPFYDEIGGVRYFFLIEDYWFIHALFFGKIAYYFIRKWVKLDVVRFSLLLVMTIVGFYSISYFYSIGVDKPYHAYNYLHFKDFLCMTIFLWVGDYLKRKNLLEKLLKGKYYAFILFLFLLGNAFKFFSKTKGFEVPALTPVILSHGGNITSIIQVPAFLLYAITGSLSCFGIARLINKSSILEYFGKNSLVVYCIHFLFLDIYITLISSFLLPLGIINAILFTFIALIMTLISCIPFIKLLQYKPFSFIIGK